MQRLLLETQIAAPAERCFLLSLNIDLHVLSSEKTQERAIAGVTHGIIGPGQTVKRRGRHFGLMLTHESIIAGYQRPHHFQDKMIHGMFRSFEHDHWFEEAPEGMTRMRDDLRFTAPLGPLGLIAEVTVLRAYFQRFLVERNAVIKQTAEGPLETWKKYVG